MIEKHSINLLQPELLPQQPAFTLGRLIALVVLVTAAMVYWAYSSSQEVSALKQKVAQLKQQNKNDEQMLASLQAELKKQQQDETLKFQLNTLKLVMKNKQALNARLTDPNKTYASGYASPMTELAKFHHQSISLQEFFIEKDEMIFSGVAKTPNAVPEWLAGFKGSELLSGKNFKNFHLYENDQKLTAFTIGSTFLNVNEITKGAEE